MSLLVGLSAAFAAQRQIRMLQPSLRRSHLISVLLYGLLVLLPTGMFFFFSYPAWAVLYLAEPSVVNTAIGFIVMLLTAFACVVGYQVGDFLLRRAYDRYLVLSIGACGVGFLLFVIMVWSRLTKVSVDCDWKEGVGLLGSELGISLLLMLPFILGGWVYLLVLFHREGNKIMLAKSMPRDGLSDEITQEPNELSANGYSGSSSDRQSHLDACDTIDSTDKRISDSRILEKHFFGKRARGKK